MATTNASDNNPPKPNPKTGRSLAVRQAAARAAVTARNSQTRGRPRLAPSRHGREFISASTVLVWRM